MNLDSKDPTKINLQTNAKKERDPTLVRMKGHAIHGNTPFDVPFISHIEGNLWQGGCQQGLDLPEFFMHLFSLYPWERYRVKPSRLATELYIHMFDSVEQSIDVVDHIAALINEAKKTGPVLVHCQAGLNRSSLLVARSLMLEGKTADEAINLLREKRSDACLCNPAFEAHLRSL